MEERISFYVSKQTVHIILKNIALIKPSYSEAEDTLTDIYITADAKYAHLQT